MRSRPDHLVLCLDGGDLAHFELHGGRSAMPTLGSALVHRAPLPSTIIPQTPVAWASMLCAAPPEVTGVWGWNVVDGSTVRRVRSSDLPAHRWRSTRRKVVLAGLPLLEPAAGEWGCAIDPLHGPTKQHGGSRPDVPKGCALEDAVCRWEAHHRRWRDRVLEVGNAATVVVVHCDSVDWFSHRYGPSSEGGKCGWTLAERLLDDLLEAFDPRSVVVVSDHGSAVTTRFIRIHDALHAAGLGRYRGQDIVRLDDVTADAAFCVSDYGAVWCRDERAMVAARTVLRELGAVEIVHIEGDSAAPTMVPLFEDGAVALVPPSLYPPFDGRFDIPSVEASGLRKENWEGDHARIGLIGTDKPATWTMLESVELRSLAAALLPEARGR